MYGYCKKRREGVKRLTKTLQPVLSAPFYESEVYKLKTKTKIL